MKKKRIGKIMLFTIVFAACLLAIGCPEDTKEVIVNNPFLGKLIILQAYGSSNNAQGVSHSFVELYNLSDDVLSLNGVSLFYASGNQNSEEPDGNWTRISLDGENIPAKASFLIMGPKQSNAARVQLDENDGDINDPDFSLSNRSFKVALILDTDVLTVQNPFTGGNNGKPVLGYIDMVGARNTEGQDFIRGFETSPARNSASEAVRRKNNIDKDNNFVDFESIRYSSDGLSDDYIELRKPRNSSKGLWNAFAPLEELEPTEGGEQDELAGKLLIFQAYGDGDGGNGNAINHNFVELYNNTDSAIDLDGITLQYTTGNSSTWTVIPLSGNIPAKGSFLILGKKNTASTAGANLTFTDNYGDINNDMYLSNTAFKVVLIRSADPLTVVNPFNIGDGEKAAGYIDMLGAYNSNAIEINGSETAPRDDITRQKSARRASLTDNDNNSTDFISLDYRLAQGMTPELLEVRKPRNSAAGSWNPFEDPEEGPPVITNLSRDLSSVTSADTVTISATVTTVESAITSVVIKWKLNNVVQTPDITMTEETPNVYSGTISTQAVGDVVEYWVSATNDLGKTSETTVQNYTVVAEVIDYSVLILNEISGEHKYVEIYNSGTKNISMNGVKLQRNDGPPDGSEWVGGAIDVIPSGAYRIILFNSFTPASKDTVTYPSGGANNNGSEIYTGSSTLEDKNTGLNTYPEFVGWGVSSGISDQQILKIAIVDPIGNPIDVFIRGNAGQDLVWGEGGQERVQTHSYSRMSDGTWAYAIPTPGAENGAKVSDIQNPGYLTAQP